jgi:hypothetical protein
LLQAPLLVLLPLLLPLLPLLLPHGAMMKSDLQDLEDLQTLES